MERRKRNAGTNERDTQKVLRSSYRRHGAKAANVVTGAMNSDGKVVNEKMHVAVAQDVLDRIGVVKQQQFGISMEGGAGIIFMPKKDDAPADKD